MRKSDAREEFELETKALVAKEMRNEILSGSGHLERIKIFRSYIENDVRHTIEEEYEMIDFVQVGADLIIHFKFRGSQKAPKTAK